MVFAEVVRRIDRAARYGERLHLDLPHIHAILASPIYTLLNDLKAKEFQASWPREEVHRERQETKHVRNSAIAGSGIEKNETTGPSAGSTGVSSVARVSASAVAHKMILQKKLKLP
ncbi:hypothetical protein D3Y57_01660 (plasmid) [Sphingomonas paeninsulae]|uniref:Uncharacterized protein n=1 Tax=Sphingomonas paeninsulae TaxID=2319844 RepID=A0A494T652_SPHPE|nr:hypothetical protein [Sphingomonas paeninsulae]AYJ84817.1 hypothetical protein D3Y57_01660 [Sphingomonas paeninsulae]